MSFSRLLAAVFFAALATTVASCTSTDAGGNTCVIAPTSPSCGGGTTTPPAGGYEPLGTYHRMVRADGTEDPNLEYALTGPEPVPARGSVFFVQGCQNPCVSFRMSVRMAEVPGQPNAKADVSVLSSANGESELSDNPGLGGFFVPNGQTKEFVVPNGALLYVPNYYKWMVVKAIYTIGTPGGGATTFEAKGKILMDYVPRT